MGSYGAVEAAEPSAKEACRPTWQLLLACAAALSMTTFSAHMLTGFESLVEEDAESQPMCVGCSHRLTGEPCVPCFSEGDCASKSLPAVHGMDVVSFRTLAPGECGAVGSAEIATEWKGYSWRFASEANRAEFLLDPTRYAPKYGGFCAFGVARESTWDDGARGAERAMGPPVATSSSEWCASSYAIVDDALYLFNTDAFSRWSPEVDVASADARWDAWFGDDEYVVNTDARAVLDGVCLDSQVGICCSCDEALGYECPADGVADADADRFERFGSDRDEHGCVASAGYSYCDVTGECYRASEASCDVRASVRRSRTTIAYGM